MYSLVGTQDDRYIAPGTGVRLAIRVDGNGMVTPQSGIVVHCWRDEDSSCFQAYVAFFGDDLPRGKPSSEPYVVRHKAISLLALADDEFRP